MAETLPAHIQDAVDQYIELYQVSKQLEERMKRLRDSLVPFMREAGVDQIRDRNGTGKVQLALSERSPVTSRYTTYRLDDLEAVLDPALLERCLATVVDKEKLDALAKLGEVQQDVLERKTTVPSYSLVVRLSG